MSQKENYKQLARLWGILNHVPEEEAEKKIEELRRKELRGWEVEEYLVANAEKGAPIPADVSKGEICAARKRFYNNTHLKIGYFYGIACRENVLRAAALGPARATK